MKGARAKALTKTCTQIGCSQARFGENCSYRNCEYHPNYDEQYVTKNLCNHPKSWWTCSFCGSNGCQRCFAFKLPTVAFCVNCFKDWLKKHKITTIEQFKAKIRNYADFGDILWNMVKEELQ